MKVSNSLPYEFGSHLYTIYRYVSMC